MFMSRWTKESLEAAVLGSATYSDVLQKIGLKCIGRNNDTLKKYLAQYEIDFQSRPHLKRDYSKGRVDPDVMYVMDSPTTRSVVRRSVIRDELIPYECAKCGNAGEWQDAILVLQLEHKNGVNNDHRLENLEFLCPNCHSQTDSWGGKSTKNVVDRPPKRSPIKKQPPVSREELVLLLNDQSQDAVGSLFHVSSASVRRWCNHYGIQRPGKRPPKLRECASYI